MTRLRSGLGVHVLVVDDHDELLELVVSSLERDGHHVVSVGTAAAATARLEGAGFDVIILDIGLAGDSGLDLCREVRERGVETPILFLTAQAAVEQRVRALDAGADDFLAKPFAVAELRARVRALARRGLLAARTWSRGTVVLDFPRRRALVDGREVPLTAKEWGILDVPRLGLRSGRAACPYPRPGVDPGRCQCRGKPRGADGADPEEARWRDGADPARRGLRARLTPRSQCALFVAAHVRRH